MQGQGYTIAITDEFLADEYGGYCKVSILTSIRMETLMKQMN